MNGINHHYVKHSIEDHLIELAIVETLVPKLPKVMNSKEEWRRLCETYDRLQGRESLRAEVCKRILTSRNTLRVFSQHLEAIKALLDQPHLSKESSNFLSASSLRLLISLSTNLITLLN